VKTSSHLDQHLKSHLLLRLEDDKPDDNEVHLYHLTGEDESAAPQDESLNQRRTSSGQDEVLVSQLDELNRTLFVKTTYDEDLLIHTGR
jgi:hypothetical protein